MARQLFTIRGDNWVGEFPHDPTVGWVNGRRGIRRTLCPISALDGLSHEEQTRRLTDLYHVKQHELRNSQMKEDEAKKKQRRERKKMTMRQVGNLWLDEVQATSSADTRKAYGITLDLYISTVGNHPLQEFDRACNVKFFNVLKNKKDSRRPTTTISKSTQNKHMRHLQVLLNWAYDHEYIDRRLKLKKAPSPKKDMDTIAISDLVAVRKHLEQTLAETRDPQQHFRIENLIRAFKMATNSLLRLGAIWSLKLEHIDLENRIIRIRDNEELGWSNKKFKWPNKPINDALYQFLQADLSNRPSSHRYFLDNGRGGPWYKQSGDITRAMKEVFQELGLPDIKVFHHGFRATMITELLTQGENPYSVQQLADHESINTTLLYLNSRKIQQATAANAIPTI